MWLKVLNTPHTNNYLQAAALVAFWKLLSMPNVEAVAEQLSSSLSQPLYLNWHSHLPERDQPGQNPRDFSILWDISLNTVLGVDKTSGFQRNCISLTERQYPFYQKGIPLHLYKINMRDNFKQILQFAYIFMLQKHANVGRKECCLNKWHHLFFPEGHKISWWHICTLSFLV